jgi:hypothetical protein
MRCKEASDMRSNREQVTGAILEAEENLSLLNEGAFFGSNIFKLRYQDGRSNSTFGFFSKLVLNSTSVFRFQITWHWGIWDGREGMQSRS